MDLERRISEMQLQKIVIMANNLLFSMLKRDPKMLPDAY